MQMWGGVHDLRLLQGIIKHGYGAWLKIGADKQLDLIPALQEEAGLPAYLQRCQSTFLHASVLLLCISVMICLSLRSAMCSGEFVVQHWEIGDQVCC